MADSLTQELPRDRVLRQIRQSILDGRWLSGELLPPEHHLVKDLGVSRSTLRLALKRLEEEGLLQASKGRGRMVATGSDAPTGLMSQVFAFLVGTAGIIDAYRNPAYEKAVEVNAMDVLHRAEFHALTLALPAINEVVVRNLIREHPRCLIADHDAANNVSGQHFLKRIASAGVKVVVHGDGAELSGYDRVVTDHALGAYELTQWLIQQGRRRILRVVEEDVCRSYWYEARNCGFLRALGENAIEPLPQVGICGLQDREVSRGQVTREHFERRVRQFVGFIAEHVLSLQSIDAVMVATDSDVYLAAAACRILGKVPNHDVAIVGYDNSWFEWAEKEWEPTRPLATVEKHNDIVGVKLAELALARADETLPLEPQRVLLAPKLVIIPQ